MSETKTLKTFWAELEEQRWDDHRYYHRSRINQSLHLVSALSFLAAYVLVPIQPIAACFLGWFVAMMTRQAGHFFFEPKDYDHVNQATHAHKEAIKIGYNLRRKVILLSVWALCPLALWLWPSFGGVFEAHVDTYTFTYNLSVLWLTVGATAILGRTIWLAIFRDWRTGVVWMAKIITDPFHDVKIYYRAPFYVLRGELLDPMTEWPTKRQAA